MLVGSAAVSLVVFVSLPPNTVAVLVTLGGALLATFTVRVNIELLPPMRGCVRVHAVSVPQVQFPGGLMAVAVNPAGSVSVNVIVPLVGKVPLLVTMMV